jgi:hypothetical protein
MVINLESFVLCPPNQMFQLFDHGIFFCACDCGVVWYYYSCGHGGHIGCFLCAVASAAGDGERVHFVLLVAVLLGVLVVHNVLATCACCCCCCCCCYCALGGGSSCCCAGAGVTLILLVDNMACPGRDARFVPKPNSACQNLRTWPTFLHCRSSTGISRGIEDLVRPTPLDLFGTCRLASERKHPRN